MKTVGFFSEVDPGKSGGKGKKLIELVDDGFPIPPGFIVTVDAFRQYREQGKMPAEVEHQVLSYYRELTGNRTGETVAVRSSATAEDLDTASFAGQQDTYLYVHGEEQLVKRIIDCWQSLFTQRAVAYRKTMNISEADIAMAVIVQRMIYPLSAGVMFTAGPRSWDKDIMVIESNWGCGETVVSGKVVPDHFEVSKSPPHEIIREQLGKKDILVEGSQVGPVEKSTSKEQAASYSLDKQQVKSLCEMGIKIEALFGKPQDIEWAFDGNGNLFILQSRSITVFTMGPDSSVSEEADTHTLTGFAASSGTAWGEVRVIDVPTGSKSGSILLAKYTNPSMVPEMIKASAIATERGGMVSHAAIVSRELGIPCVVGVTGLLDKFKDGDYILVNGTEGKVSRTGKGDRRESPPDDIPLSGNRPLYLVRNPVPAKEKNTLVPLSEYDFDFENALALSLEGIAAMFSKITYVDCFWPNPSNTGYSVFLGDYIRALHHAVLSAEEKGINAREFAHLFKTPTCVFRIFVRIARAREHLTREQRMYLARRLLTAVDVLKADNHYHKGSNRTLSHQAVAEFIKNHDFKPIGGSNIREKISRINFLLWNYAETLFWTRWSTGFDFEGPYIVNEDEGDEMIIRNGFELKPVELWPQLEKFPYKSIKISTIYRGIQDFHIDPYGHLTHSGNIKNRIIYYHFCAETEAGEIVTSTAEMNKAIEVLSEYIKTNTAIIKDFNVRERVIKQSEIEWYVLRDLIRYNGMDWQPPLSVKDRIMHEDFKENLILLKKDNKTEAERYSHYLKALDPGLD